MFPEGTADVREVDMREVDVREADVREVDVREADVREEFVREVDVREAVSEIVYYCNLVDRDQQGNPVWEFADEKITDGVLYLLCLYNYYMNVHFTSK